MIKADLCPNDVLGRIPDDGRPIQEVITQLRNEGNHVSDFIEKAAIEANDPILKLGTSYEFIGFGGDELPPPIATQHKHVSWPTLVEVASGELAQPSLRGILFLAQAMVKTRRFCDIIFMKPLVGKDNRKVVPSIYDIEDILIISEDVVEGELLYEKTIAGKVRQLIFLAAAA